MKNKKKIPESGLRKVWASKGARLALNIFFLLALLAVAIYIEIPREHRGEADKCELIEQGNADVSSSTYAALTSSGYRDARSRRVAIVSLRSGTDPGKIMNSVCDQRLYLAKLIQQLSAGGAGVIVVDKFFDPDSCDIGDPGTVALLNAVQTSPRPVIVAVATHPPKIDPRHSCLIQNPSLDFGKKLDSSGRPTDKPAAILSLSRLNKDPRKVPLNWYLYKDDRSFEAKEEPTKTAVETLSYQAAILADHDLKNEHRLNDLRDADRHPFTSFIDPDSLSQVDALDFLCSSPDRNQFEASYKVSCAGRPKVDTDFGGKVVVIGEDNPGRDRHRLFERDVPGVYLQANYIESLLDGNYLKALGAGWDIMIFVLWVTLLYLLYWFIQPEVALIISILIGAAARFAIHQLVLTKGLYPDIWVQELGLLALVLKYIDARGARLSDMIRETVAKRGAHARGE